MEKIFEYKILVKNLFYGCKTYDKEIIGVIYKDVVRKRFLWFKEKVAFITKIYTPYIKEPFYDGEYSTNRLLQTEEKLMQFYLDLKIEELKHTK